MDKKIDDEIYFDFHEELETQASISHKRWVLLTRMLTLSFSESDWAERRIGEELLQSGQLQKSILHFKRATIINPRDAVSHCELVKALFKLGNQNEAFSSMKKALSMNPEDYLLQKLLVEALEKKHKIEEFESFSKEITDMIPDPRSIMNFNFRFAEALTHRNHFSQAFVMFRKGVENNQIEDRRLFDYGVTLYNMGLFEEALVQFEHDRQLQPHSKYVLNNIAFLNYCLGRVEKALEELNPLLENGLTSDQTSSNCILVLVHLGQDEKAAEIAQNHFPSSRSGGDSLSKCEKDALKITHNLLPRNDIDEKTREFNIKKLQSLKQVLDFLGCNKTDTL